MNDYIQSSPAKTHLYNYEISDGEALAVDLRRTEMPLVWNLRTKAGAVVTHTYSNTERPEAADWLSPAEHALTNAAETIVVKEQDPVGFLRWATAGGDATIDIACAGTPRIVTTQSAPIINTLADLRDAGGVKVGQTVVRDLQPAFGFEIPEALHFSVALDNAHVTAEIVDGRYVYLTAAGVGTTVVTVTATTPLGDTSEREFEVTTVAAAAVTAQAGDRALRMKTADQLTIRPRLLFDNPDARDIDYTAAIVPAAAADLEIIDDDLKITAAAAATVGVITVTATVAGDAVTKDVTLNVVAAASALYRQHRTVPELRFQHRDIEPISIDLINYLQGPAAILVGAITTIDADIATATKFGNNLTVTPVKPGLAGFLVTAGNMQVLIPVRIDARRPELIPHLSDQQFAITDYEAISIDLSKYFRDLDGSDLTFEAWVSQGIRSHINLSLMDAALEISPAVERMKVGVTIRARNESGLARDLEIIVSSAD